MRKSPLLLLAAALAFIVLGILNYYIFRPGIVLFEWAEINVPERLSPVYRNLFNGYFSDFCWGGAIGCTVVALSKWNCIDYTGKVLILTIPLFTEACQYFSLAPGTFDWWDVFIYMSVLPLMVKPGFKSGLNTTRIRSLIFSVPIALVFFLMTLACATRKTYYQPKPLPCTTYRPLTYSPVLVTIYISGSYNMKDLASAQRDVPPLLLNYMNERNPGKYQIADGVKPNLSLYVDYITDNYGHFGAKIRGYVYDGDFSYTLDTNYVTWEKLDKDVAAQVNSFISFGWCKNCPEPCVIK